MSTIDLSTAIRDDASPLLRELASRDPAYLASVTEGAAESVQERLREHFVERNQTPNRLGGARTNWWIKEVADKTGYLVNDAGSATVTVASSQFAFKVEGGTIRPVRAKALAIPIDARAHGRSPRSFSDLTLTIRRVGGTAKAFLADADDNFLYVLKKSVTQKADPNALPSDDEIDQAAAEGAEAVLDDLDLDNL